MAKDDDAPLEGLDAGAADGDADAVADAQAVSARGIGAAVCVLALLPPGRLQRARARVCTRLERWGARDKRGNDKAPRAAFADGAPIPLFPPQELEAMKARLAAMEAEAAKARGEV